MNNLLEEAKERNVDLELVKKIWEEIHKTSLKIEK
jgi:chorismate mutase